MKQTLFTFKRNVEFDEAKKYLMFVNCLHAYSICTEFSYKNFEQIDTVYLQNHNLCGFYF